MAKKKKNFKSGLDSLIESSLGLSKKKNNDTVSLSESESVKYLQDKINALLDELYLWRTGKLTTEIFQKSLKDSNLKYNPDTNDFEIIE